MWPDIVQKKDKKLLNSGSPNSCWRYIILFNYILMAEVWFVSYLHTLGVTSKPIHSSSRCEGMTQTKPEAFSRISMYILVFLHEQNIKEV